MIFGTPRTYQDCDGSINFWTSDFIVGVDNKLIEPRAQFSDFGRQGQTVDEFVIDINRLIQSGHFGRIHVLDVQCDNPEGYYFAHYAPETKFERGKSFRNRPIGEASWTPLRQFACEDFHRVKCAKRSYNVAHVEVETNDLVTT